MGFNIFSVENVILVIGRGLHDNNACPVKKRSRINI